MENNNKKLRVMISQPMRGLTADDITETKAQAVKKIEDMGYTVVNSLFDEDYFSEEDLECVQHKSLFFLAQALEVMSMCDAVYFCKGWEDTRGCNIEHMAAESYGLAIIHEE